MRTGAKSVESLDAFYLQMLTVGLLVLRQAADEDDTPWIRAEVEFLHNIPSLIGETNLHRHRYFWSKERPHYIQWVSASGREAPRSRMRTFYEPIWQEMEPVISTLIGEAI
ncbi:hypothetical protein P12x_000308 [Tundrisphaera lichenicola]|uniref:hypothetical protein n=1 Tax=Tundrisphaera lichenicola TaxID=2029860 RepID=UPI003EBAABF4